jgi:WD40 repeat protein
MTTESDVLETALRFFTVGGTLPPDAPSYVMRQADEDLFTHLSAGHFCYLLTSRQMGKSSLMVRTTSRLKAAGARVAILDLTKIGQNVTTDQWYNGLLARLGVAFGLEDKLKEYSRRGADASNSIGPLDRWERAIREVIVASIQERIVIFVDEIDFVRSLPFPTDEFFAAIRSFYNQRTTNPELNRITFCLIGVATPSDLIRDGSRTPFNIGERIHLTDFEEQEAGPFIKGIGRSPEIATKLLRRILWWTGGHPYLTQRLAAAVAADPDVATASGVDRICNDMFLAAHSRDTDNNLLFVSHRITDRNNANRSNAGRRGSDQASEGEADGKSESELAAVLDLYGRVRSGKMVLFDKENRNVEFLLLAGIVAVHDRVPPLRNFLRKLGHILRGKPLTGAEKVSEQVLVVRNRVYERVFDRHWIRAHMPGAEARRQRAAFRRGLLMAAGLAVAVIAIISLVMLKDLEDEQKAAIQNYCANVVQVQQDFDSGDYASGYNLLRETVPLVRLEPRGAENLLKKTPLLWRTLPFIYRHPRLYAILNGFDGRAAGGIEWNYLLARSFGDSAYAYSGHVNEIRSVAISPDGQWVATAGADSTVRVFKISSILQSTSYAPDHPLDRALLVLNSNGDARPVQPDGTDPKKSVNALLVDALGGLQMNQLPGVLSVQFSPDGAWIAIATGNWDQTSIPGTVYLWSTKNPGTVIWVDKQFGKTQFARAADAVVFKQQPDARGAYDLAATSEDNTAEFWSVAPDGTVTLKGKSPAEKDQVIQELPGGQVAKQLPKGWPAKGMNAAAYSPDGKTFAMIFGDGHLWLRDGAEPWKPSPSDQLLLGDISGLMSIAFYNHPLAGPHQGAMEQLVLLGTRDGQVKLYNLSTKARTTSPYLETNQGLVTSLTISYDQNLLLTTGSTGTILVWQLVRDTHDESLDQSPTRTPGDSIMLRGQRDVTYSAAMTRDNSLIISGGASALTGGSGQHSTSDRSALVSSPGSRVLFWKKQRGYVDGFTLPGDTLPSTWVSQPASIPAGGAVQALAFSPDGREFASIVGAPTQDNAATEIDFTQLDPNTGRPASSEAAHPQNHSSKGTALAWSVDGKSVVTAMDDGGLLLWDPSQFKQGSKPQANPVSNSLNAVTADDVGLPIPIQALSFSPEGYLAGTAAAVGTPDQTFTWMQKQYRSNESIILWKPGQPPAIQPAIQKVIPLPSVTSHATFSLQQLIFSPSGDWLAACGVDNADNLIKVQIWNAAGLLGASPQPLFTLNGSEFPASDAHTDSLHGQCTAVAFSPDGEWLAVGTYSHEIAVWSTATWLRVGGQAEFITSGSLYGAKINKHGSGRYIDAPPMATSAINAVAFSPDSERLAYGTADGNIYLWSVTAQLPVSTIAVHSGGVLALAFSPDPDGRFPSGRCLASGGNDKTVRFTCSIDPDLKQRALNIATSPESSTRLTGESDDWYRFAQ